MKQTLQDWTYDDFGYLTKRTNRGQASLFFWPGLTVVSLIIALWVIVPVYSLVLFSLKPSELAWYLFHSTPYEAYMVFPLPLIPAMPIATLTGLLTPVFLVTGLLELTNRDSPWRRSGRLTILRGVAAGTFFLVSGLLMHIWLNGLLFWYSHDW